MQSSARPQAHYRERLLREVLALEPSSVLEVGCGSGTFLRSAAAGGLCITGVDPDADGIARLSDEGYTVAVGNGEELDFPDSAFDVVVFCFTAHHIGAWQPALIEALRVCRRAVLILDPWHESSIPSQRTAAQFDRWCKSIDRSSGMVHNDCMDAQTLLGPLAPILAGLDLRVEHLLIVQELGAARLTELAEDQLAKIIDADRHRPALVAIIQAAERHGFSEDGAILMAIEKASADRRTASTDSSACRKVTEN